MDDSNVLKVKTSRFSDRVVDAHHREIGFVEKGYICTYCEKDTKYGEAWLRMKKTDEIGRDRRKFLLFLGDETEPYAYVDRYNDVYDMEKNYLCSIEHSAFLMTILLLVLAIFIFSSIAVFFTGDILLQTAYWSSEVDSIDLNISDDKKGWDKGANVTTLDIFGINETITDDDGNIIETERNKKIIYPGLTGDYQFKIENVSTMALLYDCSFTDVNTYDIPMRFKLKEGREYLVGSEEEWGTIHDLKIETQKLMPERKHLYTLEWMWLDYNDAHDTELGMEAIAEYKFTIEINFRSAY